MAATPDALMEANEEQADTVDVLDVNTSSNRTIALEPPNTSSSEQVTFKTNSEPADSSIDASCSNSRYVHRILTFQVYFPLTQHQWV
jgi:hypothetical protein